MPEKTCYLGGWTPIRPLAASAVAISLATQAVGSYDFAVVGERTATGVTRGAVARQHMTENEPLLANDWRALAFCQNHNLLVDARTAIGLAKESFPYLQRISVSITDDPEEEGEYLLIEVEAQKDVDTFLRDYGDCVRCLVERLPVSALTLLRLSYSLH